MHVVCKRSYYLHYNLDFKNRTRHMYSIQWLDCTVKKIL